SPLLRLKETSFKAKLLPLSKLLESELIDNIYFFISNLFSNITGNVAVKIINNEGIAASITISSLAYSNALTARVFTSKGFKIRVKGNSFNTSINTNINALKSPVLIKGNSRSEERRVGKECRSRRQPDHSKTKVTN